jgi:hypothetical protein
MSISYQKSGATKIAWKKNNPLAPKLSVQSVTIGQSHLETSSQQAHSEYRPSRKNRKRASKLDVAMLGKPA